VATDDALRFEIPLYAQAQAARYLAMSESTLRSWAQGYRRVSGKGRVTIGGPLITYVPPPQRGGPSIPFVGLAEGMFLSALRRAGVPMQQIRPALELVQQRLGVEHALASRKLYVVGAQLLWEISEESDLEPDARHRARDLIVLKDGQYVFRQVVEGYLRRIEYASDDYAERVYLPEFEVAAIVADPHINFGRPIFASTGTPVDAVLSRIRAGEPLTAVAEDYDLPEDQVTEAAYRAERTAA
jgi:uncharacterized protein (DUF433 family)